MLNLPLTTNSLNIGNVVKKTHTPTQLLQFTLQLSLTCWSFWIAAHKGVYRNNVIQTMPAMSWHVISICYFQTAPTLNPKRVVTTPSTPTPHVCPNHLYLYDLKRCSDYTTYTSPHTMIHVWGMHWTIPP